MISKDKYLEKLSKKQKDVKDDSLKKRISEDIEKKKQKDVKK